MSSPPTSDADALARGLAALKRTAWAEARAAFAATPAEPVAMDTLHPLALLGRSAAELDRDQPRAALDPLHSYLRRVLPEERERRVPGLVLVVEARTRLNDQPEATSALAELKEIAELGGTPPLQATVRYAEGIAAAARGERDAARTLLESAADQFDTAGMPWEAATARLALAGTLADLEERDAAEWETRRVISGLRKLGAESLLARAHALLDRLRPSGRLSGNRSLLTKREREVLRLVADGQSDKMIAGDLGLSEHTVHRHMANILRKTGTSSRAAAVAKAAKDGAI
ncbi:MAG: response regulator transcription factor [Gemmatimonadales bacterium]